MFGQRNWLLVPTQMLNGYIAMIPRIRARNQLELINSMAAASGTMRKDDRMKLIFRLERLANPPDRSQVLPKPMRNVLLANVGIGLRTVRRGQPKQ